MRPPTMMGPPDRMRPSTTGRARRLPSCARLAVVHATAAVVIAALVLPLAASAQTRAPSVRPQASNAGWGEDAAYMATNALISGIVTGLFRAASDDGSFRDGFWTGAAGGAVTYVGKRVAAHEFDGAGFVGRQVASVGGSLASNARDGRGALDRLTFQLGLGRLYWDIPESRVAFRPDIVTMTYTVVAVADSRVELSWSRSLSAGTPVFVTLRDETTLDESAAGRTFGGVVLMDVNAHLPPSFIGSHERVHVIQYDQQFALWGEAAERGLVSILGPGAARALGQVDMGIALVPFAPLLLALPRDANPFELEAEHITAH
jgi:hypothetical protein